MKVKEIARNPVGYRCWRYISKRGEISLIEPSWVSMGLWEIYVIDGEDLFDDVERFSTREQAENRIKSLFGEIIPEKVEFT